LDPFLDTTYGGWDQNGSKSPLPWRLNRAFGFVQLLLPDCTAIGLHYYRARAERQKRTVDDYTELAWESMPWNIGGNNALSFGKFGVVRYRLNAAPPEDAKVEAIGPCFFTNNIEAAKIKAAEFAKGEGRL
jgi:hypothetical protein